jgi:hypothetical protein|uniref:Uncharacterized protein n=1 Tax=Myoviridae sp. ctZ2t4 TaxID=2827693 RepID=A0A8S5STD5_9CAUD|nr:MAG TPA: hypothetical protein [Myoviridae sp. ctZ2t4]
MKYKVQNNTQVKLWIGDFCFVPGTSTVEIGTSQKKGVDAILKNNKSIANLVTKKELIISKVEEQVEDKPSIEEKTTPKGEKE